MLTVKIAVKQLLKNKSHSVGICKYFYPCCRWVGYKRVRCPCWYSEWGM